MRNLKITIVAIMIIVFAAPLLMANDKRDIWSPSTYIQSAKIHYQHVYKKTKKRDDLYHCIDLLKEGADRFGRIPEFYYMLGTFYAEINALDTVVMYFDSVQVMCDDETIDKKYRKNCYKKDKYIKKMANLRQSEWEKAYNYAIENMKTYDQIDEMIAALPPDNTDSIAALQVLSKEAFDEAFGDFTNADLAKPKDSITLEGIAILLQREDRHEDAIGYYKQVLELKGGEEKADTSLISKIAYAYIYIPDWKKSIEWFLKVEKNNPNDINALVNISISYNSIGERDKWFEYTAKVLDLQPDNEQFLFNAGQYWFVKMQDAASRMPADTGDDAAGKQKRKEIEALAKEYMEKAADYFNKVIAVNPNDTDALRQLGILNLLGQNPQGAIDALTKYIEVNPNDNDILEFLGRAYILNGDSKGAIKPYEMITENDPGNMAAWERLGELYEYNKMPEKSKAANAKAEELKKL
ncbi:MAG: tetratricopeptide repeat protein [candidate division Zixibacteria bacterium]|nr:tetratricopeptide repeat protein [candidate division Zixibacteria bacterium]